MSIRFRTVLMCLMSVALFFGFLHVLVPNGEAYNFERLHIFLFNLCSGGTIILYYTEAYQNPSKKVIAFCIMATAFAVLAFFKIYAPAIGIAIILAGIVESVRIRKFSAFPINFFQWRVPVSEKFHQASLLCLSIGLIISSVVMLNNEFLKLITLPKLKLDTFFLGFSFPLSLITLSVMFSLMKEDWRDMTNLLKNIGFWFVNLGVIIFFGFILFEQFVPQIIVTTILFGTVVMIFHLFVRLGREVQQKYFLVSGMAFLLATAVTGIGYIALHFFPPFYDPITSKFILRLHAFTSLYGWNLSGLTVICRYKDFPILLHSGKVIALHWLTALVLAPLGCYSIPFALMAFVCYASLLYIVFSSKGIKGLYPSPFESHARIR